MRFTPSFCAVLVAGAACGGAAAAVAPACKDYRNVCARPGRVVLEPGEKQTVALVPQDGYAVAHARFHVDLPGYPEIPVVHIDQGGGVVGVRPGRSELAVFIDFAGGGLGSSLQVPIVVRGVYLPYANDTLTLHLNGPDGESGKRLSPPQVIDTVPVAQAVQWAVSDPAVATVAGDGVITARGLGTAHVTVRSTAVPGLAPARYAVVVKRCAQWTSGRGGGCARDA
jgi:hypothetical protein